MFSSFSKPFEAVVFGAGGGIGAAFVAHLAASDQVSHVHAFSSQTSLPEHSKVKHRHIDIFNEASLMNAAAALKERAPRLILVAIGTLHDGDVQPEKTWRHMDSDMMQHVLQVNTVAPALILKHFLGLFPRNDKSVFAALSARVGSISDNNIGGWYSYRASKAALNMLLRTASIELARRWPDAACIGLHPGTVDTKLSKPFQGNVATKKLFSPSHSAGMMLEVVDHITPEQSGQVFDYAGVPVPS
ncbi:MAG: SDR family NAD(P)-dependent oxidoreductase [Pseudomonadota bacterium]